MEKKYEVPSYIDRTKIDVLPNGHIRPKKSPRKEGKEIENKRRKKKRPRKGEKRIALIQRVTPCD